MNSKEMVTRLENGEKPINVVIRKWEDISKVPSINRLHSRHQFDEGCNNCAFCYVFKTCNVCPVYIFYGVKCDESKGINNKKYKKDFYSQYRDTGNVDIVLNAVYKLKRWYFWFKIKLAFKQFCLFIKKKILHFLQEAKLYVVDNS